MANRIKKSFNKEVIKLRFMVSGIWPDEMERLTISATEGARELNTPLGIVVGIGSRRHDFTGDTWIILHTIAVVTGRKPFMRSALL